MPLPLPVSPLWIRSWYFAVTPLEQDPVGVRMHVDESRRDDQARCVDHTFRLADNLPDRGNPVSDDGDVAVGPGIARAIDDFSISE